MIRRPPRSTLSSSSAASDVYKRQVSTQSTGICVPAMLFGRTARALHRVACRGWKPSKIAPCRAFCTADAPPPPMKREEHELSQVIPGSKTPGPKMVLGYTCTVCETRSFRTISRASYDNGVVLVRCEGCDNLHLIADNLGWFEDDSWNVAEYLKANGGQVQDLTNPDNVIEFQLKESK
eukprot:TRINITY_DN22441_c0_g1_i3.p1 TRINITY_DN22441_c0_g1~~TRINITY_DN22441_c0_g1_i3.p1  ORF type:complete len:179 (+),score=40.55 TRINITY_DN22441_c0_g1_i3:154-690(+)